MYADNGPWMQTDGYSYPPDVKPHYGNTKRMIKQQLGRDQAIETFDTV